MVGQAEEEVFREAEVEVAEEDPHLMEVRAQVEEVVQAPVALAVEVQDLMTQVQLLQESISPVPGYSMPWMETI